MSLYESPKSLGASLSAHTLRGTGSASPYGRQFFCHITYKLTKINNFHLESLICGIKQQFNPILSQVQYEVMAEWRLKGKDKQIY